nr:hypothetical protein [Paraburkholderia sacchari]
MTNRERSLRVLVDKWLGDASSSNRRITRFSHSRTKQWRYVCVETQRITGAFSVVFFRHDDGSWCVFPPAGRRASMQYSSMHGADAFLSRRTTTSNR